MVQDVAIAHGYNNIAWTVPKTLTSGRELPLNQLSDLLRVECAMAGYTEILTWALCSNAEITQRLRLPVLADNAVSIGNPATAEFEVCRTSLLPGVTFASLSSFFASAICSCSSFDHTVAFPRQHASHVFPS